VTKKQLRKEAFKVGVDPTKKKLFHECCKAISDLKKREKAKEDKKTGAFQENFFYTNKFIFAKEIVNGTFGRENGFS
jgi:hypothetical protein